MKGGQRKTLLVGRIGIECFEKRWDNNAGEALGQPFTPEGEHRSERPKAAFYKTLRR
jgi:hypothetical protein